MAQRASVLTLDHHSLRTALDPGQYHHLLQADYLELAALAGSESLLRVVDKDKATQKGECEHVLSAQAADPRCTAIVSIVPEHHGQNGNKKRQRTISTSTACFPTHDQRGKKINQGPGGDLSFLPAAHPLICKQSCKYTLLGHDGEWSTKREVRQLQCCLCLGLSYVSWHQQLALQSDCLQANHHCKVSCQTCMGCAFATPLCAPALLSSLDICHLQFASHKVYSVTHTLVPASVATISDIQPKDTTGILFTTTQPHGLKSRRTCGQLYASGEQTLSVPAAFLQTAFKVAAVPSPLQFAIQSPIKGLQEEEQLANLTTQLDMHLQAGSLRLTFG